MMKNETFSNWWFFGKGSISAIFGLGIEKRTSNITVPKNAICLNLTIGVDVKREDFNAMIAATLTPGETGYTLDKIIKVEGKLKPLAKTNFKLDYVSKTREVKLSPSVRNEVLTVANDIFVLKVDQQLLNRKYKGGIGINLSQFDQTCTVKRIDTKEQIGKTLKREFGVGPTFYVALPGLRLDIGEYIDKERLKGGSFDVLIGKPNSPINAKLSSQFQESAKQSSVQVTYKF